MNNNEVQAIKKEAVLGKEFTVYGDAFDPLFLAKDIANMLGHSDVSKMVKAVDDDEKVKNIILTPGGAQETWFLTEDGLYEVLMQSRKPVAKAFKKEVKAILRDLRLTGVAMTEDAEDEALDFNRVFGRKRLRKSIREAQDKRQLLEQFIQLSSVERTAGRMSNKDRIKSLDTFADEIENIIANEAINMRGSELLALQELLTDISKEKNRLSNKMRGGVISNKTRRIRQLEEELAMTQDDSEDDGFYFIDSHGFSANYMYSYGKDKVVKSAAYCRWVNNLNLGNYLPATCPNVDFTKPLRITIMFGQKKELDTNNLSKAIIDQIAEYYGFDDVLVHETVLLLHEYVDSYENGYMYLKIENI